MELRHGRQVVDEGLKATYRVREKGRHLRDLLVLALSPPSSPLAFVVKVHDGDTLTMVSDGVSQRVRLVRIDCPASDQRYGAEATEAQQLPIGLVTPYF